MMSLFPSGWKLPVPKKLKPVNPLGDGNVLQKILKMSGPTRKPVQIPDREMLRPEEEVDTTEIDELLSEIFNPIPEYEKNQILQAISTVNQQLQKNIFCLQDYTAENENVTRDELLQLLRMFLKYSRALENYLKNVNQVITI